MSIMNEKMKVYNVPDGYFDKLQSRLSEIPAQQTVESSGSVVSLWKRLEPYAALAACFIMAVAAGSLFLGKTSGTQSSSDISVEDYYFADIIPVSNPYMIYEDYPVEEMTSEEESSEEDIIEYLISTGASADYIAYMIDNE